MQTLEYMTTLRTNTNLQELHKEGVEQIKQMNKDQLLSFCLELYKTWVVQTNALQYSIMKETLPSVAPTKVANDKNKQIHKDLVKVNPVKSLKKLYQNSV